MEIFESSVPAENDFALSYDHFHEQFTIDGIVQAMDEANSSGALLRIVNDVMKTQKTIIRKEKLFDFIQEIDSDIIAYQET
ncbi:hypothetical protein NPIL_677671 [Nephila pilipes]|uniref:Uncharacterized protein n=1 Tax=Nephila pilipes TaxID=299642 RepID=A0A8X6U0E6_NEPPI|nr:hypothetical protein NPIL_677671 [Nephila pilipes]